MGYVAIYILKLEITIHVGIICWNGKEKQAQVIAHELFSVANKVTVIYSNRTNSRYNGIGNWIQVVDEYFYGRKFSRFLDQFDDDLGLLIQADAQCDNWIDIVTACVDTYRKYPDLGIWIPKIEGSPFKPLYTDLWMTADGCYRNVGLLDGITWCFSKPVARRLRTFDYSVNNLGWGIESAASSFCYASGLRVLRSNDVEVFHRQGAGYDGLVAKQQEKAFLLQLSCIEARWYKLFRLNHRVMAFSRIKLKRFPLVGDILSLMVQRCLQRLAVKS